ncbi:MAG TPA: hypothetical protein VFU31_04175 [Candidatus Binatia bacterium]|nr:hypothetical protein [Candidatus Binatia bacterium]
MDFDTRVLHRELAELLRWERRKRREQILSEVLFYALLAALVALPLHGWLPAHVLRWFIPALFIAALAPVFLIRRRWQPLHSLRALARLDKTLRLEERAITAWELLERKETGGTALLVLKQASEKIHPGAARALFPRSGNWQAYVALPLFVLWFAMVWFDVELRFGRGLPAPATLAHQIREFSRELQEKAKSDGLRESLRWGRELEKAAQKGIEAQSGDEPFKRELAGIAKKMETARLPAADRHQGFRAETEQNLKDLKAEVEAARDLLNFSEGAKGAQGSGQKWLERLAALPQLKKQFDPQLQGRSLGENELRSYLDKLNDQVTRELDRRTVLDAQQFLEQLTKQGKGEKGETEARLAGRGEQQRPTDGEKAKTKGHLPGDEPGRREDVFAAPPQLPAAAATQLKGLLAEGASSGMAFKGKPSPGKSEISQDEVVATYRRQAEAELEAEQVPESLKDIIKHYFLSLGMGEEKKSTMSDQQPVER